MASPCPYPHRVRFRPQVTLQADGEAAGGSKPLRAEAVRAGLSVSAAYAEVEVSAAREV